jgi:sulfide:quinone oxidoreductase
MSETFARRVPGKDGLRVLIAGGGVAALETALALRALAEERVKIQLLGPDPHFWYRPLAVLGPFGMGRVRPLELSALAGACRAEFDLGALAVVDADAHRIRTVAGSEYEYDALVVACGARPLTAVPGSFTFCGPGDSEAFGLLVRDLASGPPARLVFAVPGGVAWPLPLYELALLTAGFLADRDADGIELALVTPEEAPLAALAIAGLAAIDDRFVPGRSLTLA